MVEMKRKPSEAAVQKTLAIMRSIRDSFERAESQSWLTQEHLGYGWRQVAPTLYRYAAYILRRLAEAKVVEIRYGEETGSTNYYRPTAAGWDMLRLCDNFPAEELHRKFGWGAARFKAQATRGVCATCGSKITTRRSDAEVCWACETPSIRQRNGFDHVPRTEAYLNSLKASRRKREEERVAAVLAARRKAIRLERKEEVPSTATSEPTAHMTVSFLLSRINALDAKLEQVVDLLREQNKNVVYNTVNEHGKPNGKDKQGTKALMQALAMALLEQGAGS